MKVGPWIISSYGQPTTDKKAPWFHPVFLANGHQANRPGLPDYSFRGQKRNT